jgi:hypothetical protein
MELKHEYMAGMKHRCMALKHEGMMEVTYQINGVFRAVPNRFVEPLRPPKAFFLTAGQIKNNMNICM